MAKLNLKLFSYSVLILLLYFGEAAIVVVNGTEIDNDGIIEIDVDKEPQEEKPDFSNNNDNFIIYNNNNLNSDLSNNNNSNNNHNNISLINSISNVKHDRIRRNSIIGLSNNNNHVLIPNSNNPNNNNNVLLGNNNQNVFSPAPPTQNLEGLLASCQLTNLLLYQLINNQQQQISSPGSSPFSPLASPSSFLSAFNPLQLQPQQGPVNNPLLLTTITTTSTFTTKMTSTDVITIPLLFGNKPVPTTITRTKTYDVTSSTEVTLTSTITPTPTSTTTIIQVVPTATDSEPKDENEIEANGQEQHFETPILNSFNTVEASTNPSTSSGRNNNNKKKRKNRPFSSTPSQKQGRQLEEIESGRSYGSSPAYKFGQREEKAQLNEVKSRGGPSPINNKFRRQYLYAEEQEQEPIYDYNDYYPSEIVHVQQQRLKRRGEVEEDIEDSSSESANNIKYILEPSFDSSSNIALAEECPPSNPPVTVTVTKTITKTKLINPATATIGFVKPTNDYSYFTSYDDPNVNDVNAVASSNKSKRNFISTRGRKNNANDNTSTERSRGDAEKVSRRSNYRSTSRSRDNNKENNNNNNNEEATTTKRSRGSSGRRRSTASAESSSSTTPISVTRESNNLNNNNNNNNNQDINSRRSRSRFHANYYAGRPSSY